MMNFIIGPSIVGLLCYFLYKILQLYACRRERIMLIEKMGQCDGVVPEIESGGLVRGASGSRFVALRWGAILFGIGLGMLVAYFITYANLHAMYVDGYDYHMFEANAMVYASCSFLGGGLGMLIAFLVEIKLSRINRD